jgi:hypothetical protein
MLTKENRQEIKSPDDISAALSLLFQFSKDAQSFLLQSMDEPPVSIVLDYDHDERTLTELYIRLVDNQINQMALTTKESEKVAIRFEVFRQCYEFEAVVLSSSSDGLIVITPPECLYVIKHRRLPRITVLPEDQTQLPKHYGLSSDGKKDIPIRCLELGLKAILLKEETEGERNELSEMAFFCIEKSPTSVEQIPVKAIRTYKNGNTVYALSPRNHMEYGAIFDFYRILAYPHLRRRDEFSSSDVLSLYSEQTGYLGKFQTDSDAEQRKKLIVDAWEDTTHEHHRLTADYVTVDDEGKLAGASSAVLAFNKMEQPIWVFHQLCARASPDLLVQSGELYTWRAEYLAAREENLDVVIWFDSRSRWLERIYVKFAMQNEKMATLLPVAVIRNTFKSLDQKSNQPAFGIQKFGKIKRINAFTENAFGGTNPNFLNASGILDAIIAISEKSTEEDVLKIASLLASETGSSEINLEVTIPLDKKDAFFSNSMKPLDDVDRYCSFEKKFLISFLTCVDHSVAVTKRKQKQENHRESA